MAHVLPRAPKRGRVALAHALLVFASGIPGAARARPIPGGSDAELVAQCTLEGNVELLVHAIRVGDVGAALRALREHEDGHGWQSWPGLPDLVDAAQAVTCSSAVLDALAGADLVAGGEVLASIVESEIAGVLARHSRHAEALERLERARAATETFEEPWVHDTRSRLAEASACVAVHAGEWERALEFAEGWLPTGTCGFDTLADEARIAGFRARCFAALGRCEDIAALAQEIHELYFGQELLAGPVVQWIECAVEHSGGIDEEWVIATVRSRVPWTSWDVWSEALQCWRLGRLPRDEQIARLHELAEARPTEALALLHSLGTPGIVERLDAFDVIGGELRSKPMAGLLARTGHPAARGALDRARAAMGASRQKRLDWLEHAWRIGQPRWTLLTAHAR